MSIAKSLSHHVCEQLPQKKLEDCSECYVTSLRPEKFQLPIMHGIRPEIASWLLKRIWLLIDCRITPSASSSDWHQRRDWYISQLSEACFFVAVYHRVLPPAVPVLKLETVHHGKVIEGGYSRVREKALRSGGTLVKVAHKIPKSNAKILNKGYQREAVLGSCLNHPYLLKVHGVSAPTDNADWEYASSQLPHGPSDPPPHPRERHRVTGLVTEWMKYRSLAAYRDHLKNHTCKKLGTFDVDKPLFHAALALRYLHEQGIVHGDLHIGNILIDERTDGRLCDIGFALIADGLPGAAKTSNSGFEKFIAPEHKIILDRITHSTNKQVDYTGLRKTKESDVYAFGCTCMQAYTNWKIHGQAVNPSSLKGACSEDSRPNLLDMQQVMSRQLYRLIESCMQEVASKRPSMASVVQELENILTSYGPKALAEISRAAAAIKGSKEDKIPDPLPLPSPGILQRSDHTSYRILHYAAVLAYYRLPLNLHYADANNVKERILRDTNVVEEWWKLVAKYPSAEALLVQRFGVHHSSVPVVLMQSIEPLYLEAQSAMKGILQERCTRNAQRGDPDDLRTKAIAIFIAFLAHAVEAGISKLDVLMIPLHSNSDDALKLSRCKKELQSRYNEWQLKVLEYLSWYGMLEFNRIRRG